ncbi:hypothetical protein ACLB1Q_08890 [Escherichia coli]
MSSDAYHMTSPPENGAGAAYRQWQLLWRDAGIEASRLATLTRRIFYAGWR